MDIPGFNLNSPEDSQAALELNERFISRYTELLDRFSVLPGCDAIIYEQLKGEFPADFLQSINNFTFLPPPGDPTLATANDMADGEAMPSPEELAQENEEANNIPDEELPPQLRTAYPSGTELGLPAALRLVQPLRGRPPARTTHGRASSADGRLADVGKHAFLP